MDDAEAQLRAVLREIERMIGEADRDGIAVERWVVQLADELRTAVPDEQGEEETSLAERMLSDPDRSMVAQAHAAVAALGLLKG